MRKENQTQTLTKHKIMKLVRIIVGTGHNLPLEEFYASGRRKVNLTEVFWRSKLSQLAVRNKQAMQTGRAGQASRAGQGRWSWEGGQGRKALYPLTPFWHSTAFPPPAGSAKPEVSEKAFVQWAQAWKLFQWEASYATKAAELRRMLMPISSLIYFKNIIYYSVQLFSLPQQEVIQWHLLCASLTRTLTLACCPGPPWTSLACSPSGITPHMLCGSFLGPLFTYSANGF